MNFDTKEALLLKTESIIGHKIRDFDIVHNLKNENSKGNIGHIIEKGFYGYDINNNSAPDFENLGVELKVTGYKWVRKNKQVSAKERLVLTMIDYHSVVTEDFYTSQLFSKLSNILLILYEYEENVNPYDFVLTNYYMYEFDRIPEKDRLIIEDDWKTIINKIQSGYAHELSEGDTFYLGACTKGASKKSVTTQPFSNATAMRRAFSLKTNYMTSLFRAEIFNEFDGRESFIKNIDKLRNTTLEDVIYDTFNPYRNLSLTQIDRVLETEVQRENNKQFLKSYTSTMMNVHESNLNTLEEFEKANIQIKTVRLGKNDTLKESMSFPSFDFSRVSEEDWENSEIKDMFSTTKFLFVVFKEIDISLKEYEFIGVHLWNMPLSDIETHVKTVWERTNAILNSQLTLNIKNNNVYNNFPKMSENPVSHVRPHAQDRTVTYPLPFSTDVVIENNDNSVDLSYLDNHRFTRQCFWLNSNYILTILNNSNLVY